MFGNVFYISETKLKSVEEVAKYPKDNFKESYSGKALETL